ncbi:MAG: D-glycero-beta-D-manno-heptose-7-phosphate kinase [Hydrogenothermaceae bacterium]|nr:D-glycero-beta-D-manno-heptose-7-phosphate kinase [Hydrogenothermaceae bacterium]
MITRERAEFLIDRFKDRKIAVIGDVILDKYLWGDVERISPEAPVPVVEVKRETYNLGGASNVAWNLSALGVKTVILGVVGKDENGKLIEKMLLDKNITPNLIIDNSRPTIEKTRIIAVSQQLLRIDRESREDLSTPIKKEILKSLKDISSDVEGFVISDYGKGVIFEEIVKFCVSTGKPIFVDPKPKNFNLYKNITIMTPNKKEAYECVKASTNMPLEEVGYRIMEQLSMNTLLITLGGEGMALFEGKSVKRIPAKARKVFDVTGAGDTVISILAASKLSGGSWEESATLANYGAGYVVGEIGTAVVTPDILLDTVLSY